MGKVQHDATIDTWGEAQTWGGKELVLVQVGADKVEEGSIRKRLEAIEFDCPLHYDEKVAKQAGFKGIIAPFSMTPTYATPPYWQPGEPLGNMEDPLKLNPLSLLTRMVAPATLGFATGFEIEFFAPLYVGDRISAFNKLTDIVSKELSVGKGMLMTMETTYRNQRDEVVGVSRFVLFRFVPHQRKRALENE